MQLVVVTGRGQFHDQSQSQTGFRACSNLKTQSKIINRKNKWETAYEWHILPQTHSTACTRRVATPKSHVSIFRLHSRRCTADNSNVVHRRAAAIVAYFVSRVSEQNARRYMTLMRLIWLHFVTQLYTCNLYRAITRTTLCDNYLGASGCPLTHAVEELNLRVLGLSCTEWRN